MALPNISINGNDYVNFVLKNKINDEDFISYMWGKVENPQLLLDQIKWAMDDPSGMLNPDVINLIKQIPWLKDRLASYENSASTYLDSVTSE